MLDKFWFVILTCSRVKVCQPFGERLQKLDHQSSNNKTCRREN